MNLLFNRWHLALRKKKAAKKKPAVMGRPTKYDPSYCVDLMEHMGKGLSFESFASTIQVNRDTLYAWRTAHKDFSDAWVMGRDRCLTFWENLGAAGIMGLKKFLDGNGEQRELNTKGFNNTLWIYNMKVRFGRDWIEPDKAAMMEKVTRFLEAKEAQEVADTSDAPVEYIVEMNDAGKFKHSRPKLIKASGE